MRIGVNPWLRWLFTFDLRYLRNPRLNGCSAVSTNYEQWTKNFENSVSSVKSAVKKWLFGCFQSVFSKRQQTTANDSKWQQTVRKLQQITANDYQITANHSKWLQNDRSKTTKPCFQPNKAEITKKYNPKYEKSPKFEYSLDVAGNIAQTPGPIVKF